MTLDEYLTALGLTNEHRAYARSWQDAGLTVQEALTQRCSDCHAIIDLHTTALWRVRPHVIRCAGCQHKARSAGATAYDAKFVD